MTTRRILVTSNYLKRALNDFLPLLSANSCEVITPGDGVVLSAEQLSGWVSNVDAVICGDDQFTADVMGSANRLKLICKWGTGTDSIDREAAGRLGIEVVNSPDIFTNPVADTVLAYILAFARDIIQTDRRVRGGQWEALPAFSLGELTLGVIGIGNIGKAVLRRAHAFKMRLLGADIVTVTPAFCAEVSLEMTTTEDLLREADYISLNCDLNPTSYHLINSAALSIMKPSAILINTSRGKVVSEVALIESLAEGRLRGAALDVFEREPLPLDSELRTFSNVLLASHRANSSPTCHALAHKNAIEQVLRGLSRSRHE